MNKPKDIQTFINLYKNLKQQYPTHGILLSLDDFSQASYTAMHATHTNDGFYLDDEDIDEAEFEYLQAKQIQNALKHFDGEYELFNKLYYSSEDIQKLVEVNCEPMVFLDDEITVMHFEGFNDIDKLAFLPNGYFSCDLKVYENLKLIQLLALYGWEFFGIGASLLGFIKKDADLNATNELLKKLYHVDDMLKHEISKNNYLFLGYAETLADLVQL